MFGLSFLSPLFLAGIAAAAIPIAIHLFFRRVEPIVEFSATRFLQRAPVEYARRRRLRELLLLALRISALLLLALAFARPYLTQSAAALAAPATMVMVDTSASMSAPGQFARAQARAAGIVRNVAQGTSVGVIAFGGVADVVAPLSQDRAVALSALEQLRPGAGATRYRTALARAAETIGERPGRVVVVTDLQESGWDASNDAGTLSAAIAVVVEDIGAPPANLAVTALRVDGSDAVAVVRSFAERVTTSQVAFAVEGKPAGTAVVTVSPGGAAEARVRIGGAAKGVVSAAVRDADGYTADNVRYTLLDAAASPRVLAVTTSGQASEAFFLGRALEIAEGAGGFRFRIVSGQAFSDLAPADLSDVQVIALLGTRGIEPRGRQLLANYVAGGGGLLLTTGPDVDAAIVGQALRAVVHSSWRPREATALRFAPEDSRHPIFRVFGGAGRLSDVRFSRAPLVTAGPQAAVIARYSDGTPALVEEQAGDGRVLIFASDLNNRLNDFPLQPAFVPFVHETLKHLASRAATVEYVVGELPGSDGSTPGVVTVAGSRRVVVNLDPRESNPARMTAETFKASVAQLVGGDVRRSEVAAQEREAGQRLWQYALLLMVVSLLAEGVVGRRLG